MRRASVTLPSSQLSACVGASLRFSVDGVVQWKAAWSTEDFIARSAEDSIADEIDSVWVGCITGQCIDRL